MITDHKGNIFETINDMCQYWNVPSSAYYRKKNKNIALQDILEPVGTEPKITDHLGNKFVSISAMCRQWNVSVSTYLNRINKLNMSVKDALTVDNSVRDHNGNIFLSVSAMCRHWNIPTKVYNERIAHGWAQKDALTRPKKPSSEVTDHLGNRFQSQKEMCEYYNISVSSFMDRIRKGMSLEDALTKPKTSGNTTVCDHLGNTFSTKKEMAEYYGISEKTYAERLRKGLSQEKALTSPAYYNNPQGPFIVHEGNVFPTMIKMAQHWGLSDSILYDRLRRMTLEDALTKPTGWRGDFRDHKGKKYASMTELCKAYNIGVTTYNYRINSKWPLNAALLLPKKMHIKNNMVIRQGYTVTKQIETNYYECDIDGETVICSQQKILSDMANIIEERDHNGKEKTFNNN